MTIHSLVVLFPSFEPVSCSISSSYLLLLTCIQVSQETGNVIWYPHLFNTYPQFAVIPTVKDFSTVNQADVFMDFFAFSMINDSIEWAFLGAKRKSRLLTTELPSQFVFSLPFRFGLYLLYTKAQGCQLYLAECVRKSTNSLLFIANSSPLFGCNSLCVYSPSEEQPLSSFLFGAIMNKSARAFTVSFCVNLIFFSLGQILGVGLLDSMVKYTYKFVRKY